MVKEIRELCVKHGTNIKALEKELGFGNGTIRKWDDQSPSLDRFLKVVKRLNTSVYELTGDPELKENTASENGSGKSAIDIIFDSLSPANQTKLLELARLFLEDQRKKEETQ